MLQGMIHVSCILHYHYGETNVGSSMIFGYFQVGSFIAVNCFIISYHKIQWLKIFKKCDLLTNLQFGLGLWEWLMSVLCIVS